MLSKELVVSLLIVAFTAFAGCSKEKSGSPVGSSCEDHSDCKGFCFDPGDGSEPYCTDTCTPGDDTCPDGYECSELDNLGYVCLSSGALGELGDECTAGGDCESGFCNEDVCSECEANGDCEGDQECMEDQDLGYFICGEAKGELGDECVEGADCQSGFCREEVCSECEGDNDCPGAQTCVEDADLGYYVCLGGEGELGDACTEGADCASGFCNEEVCSECEGNGDCEGSSICVEDTELGYFVCEEEAELAALGEACTEGVDCESGFCNEEVCSECENNEDCAGANECVEDTDLGYFVCQGGAAALGEACTEGADCESGFCNEEVCSECEFGDDCDGTQECVEDADLGYYVCEGVLAGLGETCTEGADCESGFCNENVCSECEVNEDCGGANECVEDADLGYYVCEGGTAALGDACTEGADCASGYCYEQLGEDVCSECEVNSDCDQYQICDKTWDENYATCKDAGELGDPCIDGADCQSGYCYETQFGDNLCSECEANNDCQGNQTCNYTMMVDPYATCG